MKFGLKRIFSKAAEPLPEGKQIILTGIPRSGTTLACRLLSECTNTIALNEPLGPSCFPDKTSALACIDQSFRDFRRSLLLNGTAPARTRDGVITDNAYSADKTHRERVVQRTQATFDAKLDPDFMLIMKHCAEFTLILPELKARYDIFAIVRNPLAIWSSWASVDVPVSRGKVAKSAKLLPELSSRIDEQPSLFEKQGFILDWYFSQYMDLAEDRVIRYEDLIASNGTLLQRITGRETPLWSLEGRNTSKLYDLEFIEKAGHALLTRPGSWLNFYSPEDIRALLHQMQENAA